MPEGGCVTARSTDRSLFRSPEPKEAFDFSLCFLCPLWQVDLRGNKLSRPIAEPRAAYRHFQRIPTRWMDNDVYGHVNNVVYYSYFDTVVNQYLIEQGVLDIEHSQVIGLVVETQCKYFAPLTFPDVVSAGLRVARLGNSSVRYEIGLFRNDDDAASAQGHFIHVYVDRATRKPTALPQDMRGALARIAVNQ
jgi:acyl-CoA thioester hydrolase